jgi:hypothetical protein
MRDIKSSESTLILGGFAMVLPFGPLNGNNQIGKLMVKIFGQGKIGWP